MSKRSFSPSRLYKVARTLVIIITLFSALLGFYGYYLEHATTRLADGFNTCDKEYDSILQNEERDSKVWNLEKNSKDKCIEEAIKNDDEFQTQTYTLIYISIFLPIFFFGSVRLYKYVFPLK